MSRPTPPTYKTRNWPAYNEALKRRGSLTIWFDPEMSWEAAPTCSVRAVDMVTVEEVAHYSFRVALQRHLS